MQGFLHLQPAESKRTPLFPSWLQSLWAPRQQQPPWQGCLWRAAGYKNSFITCWGGQGRGAWTLLQTRHLLSFILDLHIQWHRYSGNPDLASCLSFKQFNLYSRWENEHVHEITPCPVIYWLHLLHFEFLLLFLYMSLLCIYHILFVTVKWSVKSV